MFTLKEGLREDCIGRYEWQWQMVYMAHGITDQVEGPLAEGGGQDWQKKRIVFFPEI